MFRLPQIFPLTSNGPLRRVVQSIPVQRKSRDDQIRVRLPILKSLQGWLSPKCQRANHELADARTMSSQLTAPATPSPFLPPPGTSLLAREIIVLCWWQEQTSARKVPLRTCPTPFRGKPPNHQLLEPSPTLSLSFNLLAPFSY